MLRSETADSARDVDRKATTPGTSHASVPRWISKARHLCGAYVTGDASPSSSKAARQRSSITSVSPSSSCVNEKSPAVSRGTAMIALSRGYAAACSSPAGTEPTYSVSWSSVT